ncbi:MAG: hypothetical protein ACK4UN_15665, partial [Limisphaerales bacterium]
MATNPGSPRAKAKKATAESAYDIALKILIGRAFRMHQKVSEIFKKLFGRAANTPDTHENKPLLRTIYLWLIAPFSLWPIDFSGLSEFVYSQVKRDKPLDEEMKFLLQLVKELPSDTAQRVIGDYEHVVQQGAYDQLVGDDAKYAARLKELLENPEYHRDLAILKKLYDLTDYESKDTKRIIRRTLVCERNIRVPDFLFRWGRKQERFIRVFDCFCWKYSLYGLENGEKPLLMKVTVNPTPHGLILFVPAWMHLDIWRDLTHSIITDLIRARGVLRQGPKFSESRLERQQLGRRTFEADLECKKQGLIGKDRLEYIIEKAGLPPMTSQRKMLKYRAI